MTFGANFDDKLSTKQNATVTTHWNQVMNNGASSCKKYENNNS